MSLAVARAAAAVGLLVVTCGHFGAGGDGGAGAAACKRRGGVLSGILPGGSQQPASTRFEVMRLSCGGGRAAATADSLGLLTQTTSEPGCRQTPPVWRKGIGIRGISFVIAEIVVRFIEDEDARVVVGIRVPDMRAQAALGDIVVVAIFEYCERKWADDVAVSVRESVGSHRVAHAIRFLNSSLSMKEGGRGREERRR